MIKCSKRQAKSGSPQGVLQFGDPGSAVAVARPAVSIDTTRVVAPPKL